MAAMALLFTVSCEENEDENTPGAEDIKGSRIVDADDDTWTLKITDNEFNVNSFPIEGNYTYTYTAGNIFLTREEELRVFHPSLILDGTVLILEEVLPEDADEYLKRNLEPIAFFKKDAKIPCTAADIKGAWHWAAFHNDDDPRIKITIDGNNIEVAIPIWRTINKGTFTYSNGYINMNVNADLSTGQPFEGTKKFPFVVNGDKGYGVLANLPGLYKKQ